MGLSMNNSAMNFSKFCNKDYGCKTLKNFVIKLCIGWFG